MSQEPTTESCPWPDESSQYTHPLFLKVGSPSPPLFFSFGHRATTIIVYRFVGHACKKLQLSGMPSLLTLRNQPCWHIYLPINSAVWRHSGVSWIWLRFGLLNNTVSSDMILIIVQCVTTLAQCFHTSSCSWCCQTLCHITSELFFCMSLICKPGLPASHSWVLKSVCLWCNCLHHRCYAASAVSSEVGGMYLHWRLGMITCSQQHLFIAISNSVHVAMCFTAVSLHVLCFVVLCSYCYSFNSSFVFLCGVLWRRFHYREI